MRLISSFCALACVSALPLAAVAQTAAEPPAPETAPDTAGRTVLDVTASGTLTGLAADALGPDAALTVRLHGPVAFDVDTADFDSLEIFADDPAVKLTVSDTAAYDRITAVSIPAAASGEPAAATFSAAAASAGIATLADTAGDGGTIPNHLSVNVKGNVDEISGTSSASGLAPWRFNDSEWVNTTEGSGSTITVSEAAFKVTSVGNTWSLSSSDGMDRIASQISRLGAMGDGYRDGEWTVEASNIPYDEYSLILYLATDNESKVWSRTKLIQGSSETYYYYADEDGQRILKSTDDDETTWGTTTDIATDGRAAHVGRDIMVIPGLSGSSFTFNLDGTSGPDVKRGGLFGFQVVKSRDIKIEDNVADAQLSSFDVVGDKNGYLTDAFVTATLGAGSTLTIDTSAFYHLTLKGPDASEGTATLKIAADVDFSKIDLSEATNVNIKFVAPQEGGNTPLAVTGSLQASGDVTISTPVTLTVDGADVTPYWSVGGTLTIADGGTLTVDAAEGVTLPNPYRVIQANTISVESGATLTTPESSAYKAVPVDNNAVWVISNKSIRPVAPVETQTWTDLLQREWVTEGGVSVSPVQITTESSVVLELADGATLTVDESILDSGTVPELALRVTNGGKATITVSAESRFPFAKTMVAVGTVKVEGAAELGAVTILEGAHLTFPTVSQKTATSVSGGGVLELGPESATETEATVSFPIDIAELIASNCTISGSTLTVANQVTVAAGTVGLPKDAVFATETRGVKPVLEIAGGATAVVDAANTTLVQRNTIRGTNANATLRVTNSSGYNLRNAGTDNVPILENVRLEVPEITASHAGDPWLRNATIAFTGGTSTWTAANWVKADGTVTVEVPGGSTVTFDTARAFWREGEPKLVKTGAGTFAVKVQNIPIEVREGRLELTWDGANRPATTVAAGATLAMASADTMSLGDITGNGTIEITGSTAVSRFGMDAGNFNGTLRVTEDVTKSGDWTIPCNVELNGTAGAGLTVGNGYTLSGTGAVTGTLTFVGGATLDASVGALTVGGLVQPDTGTVTVTVAGDAAVGTTVLKLSSGTADALAAAQFTVAERDTLRVAASGLNYVLATRMPTNGEASVTVTKPADGSSVNWSELQWTVDGDTYPSAAAGATNALTITIPAGTTVTVNEPIAAKSVNVVVTGDGIGTLSVEDRSYIMGIRERLLTDANTLVTVPRKSTDAGLMDLSKVAGTGILEITDGMGDGTAKASGFGLTADFADGTLRIDTGVTVVDNPFAPVCNLDLLGTVEGNLTIAAGKSFGGTGTVKGMLSLSDNYILNCGTSPAQVPLIQGDTVTGRHFNTDHTPVNGRLWRDSGATNYVIRTAKTPDDSDTVYVRQSSGYLVETFREGDVQGLRLPTAVELDLRSLQGDTGKTSAILKWDEKDSWIIPGGEKRLPGENDTVRIMVPASRDVTLVIPPGMISTISALDVIGMTGSAAGWTIGTLRIVEGTVENGEVVPATSFTSTLTTSDLLLSGPMNIIHECNIIAGKDSDPSAILPAAAIGSGDYGTVNIKAGTLQVKGYLKLNNIALTVGGEEGSSVAKLACMTISSTTPEEALSDKKWTGLKIMPSATLEFVGLKDLSPADTVELAGGTLRAADGWGSVIYDEVLISAESKIDLGTNSLLTLSSFGAESNEYVGFTGEVKVDIVGSGTLDVTQAQGDHGYAGYLNFVEGEGNEVIFNLGQRRPTINGKPYKLDFKPTDTENEAGEVSVAVHDVATFVIPKTITVNGWEKAATALYDGKLRVTKVGYPVESDGSSIVPKAFSDATVQALREAAGSPVGNFTVNLKTVNGKSLAFDAGAIDAAMTVFTNVAKEETNGSVTVAYAFGISDITVKGDDIIVTAKVLGPKGADMPADFAEAASVVLYRDDVQSTAVPSAGTEAGTQVFRLEGALSTLEADSAATFTVKATSGVEQTPDESVPDEGAE